MGLWPLGTSRTQQGGCREEFFNHPVSLLFFFSLSFVFLSALLSPSPPSDIVLSLPLLQLHPVMQGSYGGTSAYMQHTHVQTDKHASMKASPLKTLRQQKQQAVVCGLIAPTGCGIIELDMTDRSVSGTKCTNEFLAALTMALIYRLFWSFLLCFIAQ